MKIIETSEKALVERAVSACLKRTLGSELTVPSKAEAESETSLIYKLKIERYGHVMVFFIKAYLHFTINEFIHHLIIRDIYKRHNLESFYKGLYLYKELPVFRDKLHERKIRESGLGKRSELDFVYDIPYSFEDVSEPQKNSVLIEIQRWITGRTLEEWLKNRTRAKELTRTDKKLLTEVAGAIASWHLERDCENLDVHFDTRNIEWEHISAFSTTKKSHLYEEHLRNILQRVYKHRPLWDECSFPTKSELRLIHKLLEKSIGEFGVQPERLVSLHGDLRDRNIKIVERNPKAHVQKKHHKKEILCVDPHEGGYGDGGWDIGRFMSDFVELGIIYENSWFFKAAEFLLQAYAKKVRDDGRVFQTCVWGLSSRFMRKITSPKQRQMNREKAKLFLKCTEQMLIANEFNYSETIFK